MQVFVFKAWMSELVSSAKTRLRLVNHSVAENREAKPANYTCLHFRLGDFRKVRRLGGKSKSRIEMGTRTHVKSLTIMSFNWLVCGNDQNDEIEHFEIELPKQLISLLSTFNVG